MMALRLDAGSHGRLVGLERGSCSWRGSNELLGRDVLGGVRPVVGVKRGAMPAGWRVGKEGGERRRRRRGWVVEASSSNVATGVVKNNRFKINLDEYMVTLEKPIGIRFAQTLSGKVYVEAIAKKVNRLGGFGR
jgi:hypothetical protein